MLEIEGNNVLIRQAHVSIIEQVFFAGSSFLDLQRPCVIFVNYVFSVHFLHIYNISTIQSIF